MIELLHQPLFLETSLLVFLAISAIVILGSSLQASAGFGSGLVAIPLISLVDLRFIPGPIIFAYIFLNLFMSWKDRQDISKPTLKGLVSGLAFGSILSFFALFFITPEYFPVIAALLVLLGVGLSLFATSIKLDTRTLVISGTLSGIMSTLAGLSGPPMALALQFQKPSFIRANLGVAFIFASLFSIAVLFSKERFHINDMALGSLMVPGMILGFIAGKHLSKNLKPKASRWMILGISTASALSLLYKSL